MSPKYEPEVENENIQPEVDQPEIPQNLELEISKFEKVEDREKIRTEEEIHLAIMKEFPPPENKKFENSSEPKMRIKSATNLIGQNQNRNSYLGSMETEDETENEIREENIFQKKTHYSFRALLAKFESGNHPEMVRISDNHSF